MARVIPTIVRPEPRRDQWGRYLLPDPFTGKERAWTRATTWASAISDNFGLEKWKVRMTALGLVNRADLYAGLASVSDPETPDGKKRLNAICEEAQEFAGSRFASNLGTALHAFCEQIDQGQEPTVPPPYDQDVAAYREALARFGISVSPNYIERICVLPELEIAGTMDRLVTLRGRRYIGDIKTGADLTYSWLEISIQLAIYAHAETVFDPAENRHFRMPEVDQERALVIHLPAGQARCTPYLIDIEAGWKAAQICKLVRDWRKRKDLVQTLESVLAIEAPTEAAS